MTGIESLWHEYTREEHIPLARSELHTFLSENSIEFFSTVVSSDNNGAKSKDGKWCCVPSPWIDDDVLEMICNMQNLQYLDLFESSSSKEIKSIPNSFSRLTNLKFLCLLMVGIRPTPEAVRYFRKLEVLWFDCGRNSRIPQWIGELKHLRELYIFGKGIDNLPDELFTLEKLEQLTLEASSIHTLPEDICKLTNLINIDLLTPNLLKLPKDIPIFKNLRHLDLRNITLDEIPAWVFYQNLPFVFGNDSSSQEGVWLDCARLLHQPISLFETDREFIKAYYEAEKVRLNEVKVIFLGDGEAGKSHII